MSDKLKEQVAQAALAYIEDDMVIGVGTGSTVDYFIEALATIKHRIEGAVASSEKTKQALQQRGIRVFDLTSVNNLPLYIDGADEVNPHFQLVKGGGGALTREKILAFAAKKFVCIVDESKMVNILGQFPLAIEVLPMARSVVARELVKLGGSPAYREGFVTDNGNIILDVHNLAIMEPFKLEQQINMIPGVVDNGIFAHRGADEVLISSKKGVEKKKKD